MHIMLRYTQHLDLMILLGHTRLPQHVHAPLFSQYPESSNSLRQQITFRHTIKETMSERFSLNHSEDATQTKRRLILS